MRRVKKKKVKSAHRAAKDGRIDLLERIVRRHPDVMNEPHPKSGCTLQQEMTKNEGSSSHKSFTGVEREATSDSVDWSNKLYDREPPL